MRISLEGVKGRGNAHHATVAVVDVLAGSFSLFLAAVRAKPLQLIEPRKTRARSWGLFLREPSFTRNVVAFGPPREIDIGTCLLVSLTLSFSRSPLFTLPLSLSLFPSFLWLFFSLGGDTWKFKTTSDRSGTNAIIVHGKKKTEREERERRDAGRGTKRERSASLFGCLTSKGSFVA